MSRPCVHPRPRCFCLSAALLTVAVLAAPSAGAQKVLFDARHAQTAGSADWIVDADSSLQVWSDFRCRRRDNHHSGQRFPTPPQSEITVDTPETFWDGGISAWAVALAKDALDPGRGRSWQIEQYPWNAPELTFGDATNPQDLSGYDVFIVCEPNVLFSDAEAQAVREFVAAGGGLFLCADHETSDRNCSGGGVELHDSPFILNRLMRTDVETQHAPPYFDAANPAQDYGVFGIWFYENDNDDPDDADNHRFDWFTEAVNDNASPAADDPILHGPFGDGSGGLGFFGATQMAVSTDPQRGNPTARAHLWRNGESREPNALGVSEHVTFASARFGAGRVVAVGDSSPADDGTGEGSLHPGWDKAVGGVANHVIFLNASEWIANPEPDATAPVITAGPAVAAADCSATVTWVTDEPATSTVAWGESLPFQDDLTRGGTVTGHSVELAALEPQTTYHFQVSSTDASGNGPTASPVSAFTTTALQPIGLNEPVEHAAEAFSITLSWRTAKPTLGSVEAREADGDGMGSVVASVIEATASLDHTVTLAGLEPATAYRIAVRAADGCGNHEEVELEVSTAEAPLEIDLSGWRLVNDNPDFEYTFPAGTRLLAGGYLVLGRADDRAGFESEWGLLDENVVYLDSSDEILVNATPRPYTLLDALGSVVDGPTVAVGKNKSLSRVQACTDAAIPAAWQERSSSAADPGRGSAAPCGAGVVISEISDAGDFRHEYVELQLNLGQQ